MTMNIDCNEHFSMLVDNNSINNQWENACSNYGFGMYCNNSNFISNPDTLTNNNTILCPAAAIEQINSATIDYISINQDVDIEIINYNCVELLLFKCTDNSYLHTVMYGVIYYLK